MPHLGQDLRHAVASITKPKPDGTGETGVSNEEAAEMVGIEATTLYRYFGSERLLPGTQAKTMGGFARLLKISVPELVDRYPPSGTADAGQEPIDAGETDDLDPSEEEVVEAFRTLVRDFRNADGGVRVVDLLREYTSRLLSALGPKKED